MGDDLVKRLRDGCSCICQCEKEECKAYSECRDADDAADRIEELEAKLAKAVAASYQLGMEAALKVIASIGYGKNEDVDCGHEEAFRAVEAHLADWKAATLAELKGEK